MTFDESFRGAHTLTFRAIDRYGYVGTYSANVTFEDRKTDTTITILSPIKESAVTRIYGDQFFNLRFSVSPGVEEIKSINAYFDGSPMKGLNLDMEQSLAINDNRDGTIGIHTIEIETIDAKNRKTRKSFPFEIIAR